MFHHTKMPGDFLRGLQFDPMPLAVIEGERIALETIAPGNSQARRGIQAAAQ